MDKKSQDTLADIYARDGALHPAKVLDEASDVASPLHKHFTWDDGEAAQQHRLNQARNLIRVAVKVIPAISNRPVREYISVSTLRGTATGSYLSVVAVMDDAALRRQALKDALTTLQSMATRYAYLSELSPVWDALATLTANADAA